MKTEKASEIKDINTLVSFLAERNIPEISVERLSETGIHKTDLLVLLGNSSIFVAETAASAFKAGLADRFMICGGIGHSTSFLCDNVKNHPVYHTIDTLKKPEAVVFKDIITTYLGIPEDQLIIEDFSTNCGSNAEEALKMSHRNNIFPETILLLQDPVLQKRSRASFRKYFPETDVISYAAFVPFVMETDGQIVFENKAHNEFCSIDRFLSLIMGELPRLRNDKEGYGPAGKGFIAEVEIRKVVSEAYERLLVTMKNYVRQ